MKTLTLYRPRVGANALENALSDFDRCMDSFFGDSFLSPSDRILNSLVARIPSVDVRENEKAYVIEAELPGFDEKDIEVRLEGNNLTIGSKKTVEKNEEKDAAGEGNFLIRERRFSSFSRSFKLPENTDNESISASFKNGVLSLEIGKKTEAQQRLIPISKE